MKRSLIGMQEVVERANLERAFRRAAQSAKRGPELERFSARFDEELTRMRCELLDGNFAFGNFHAFEIHDPKRRRIHAPCFRQRVAHHALMGVMGPVLDRTLIDDTFACRVGKGTLAAVQRAQCHLRKYTWYVQIDMAAYFDSIDHEVLCAGLARRFKSRELLGQCERLIGAYQTRPNKGLPIGALTSQHFANYYLAAADRFILEQVRARGIVRYMDDVVWWCDSREEARAALDQVRAWLCQHARLRLKEPSVIQRSDRGLSFCGFRILRGQLRLGRRRQRRYIVGRANWEAAYSRGLIAPRALQRGYDCVLATTAHADARAWRCEQLIRTPGVVEA